MTIAPAARNDDHPAPCRDARKLLATAVAVTGLLVFAVSAHWIATRHDDRDAARRWMKTLALSAPAIWAAGSPLRHPETLHPGVDLRHIPGLETLP